MAKPYMLGKDSVLYLAAAVFTAADNAAVVSASGTMVATSKAKDVSLDLSKNEFDSSTRGEDFATVGVAQTVLAINAQLQIKTGDANYAALLTAFLAGNEVGIVCLDQIYATTGAQGPAGNFVVTGFTHQQPLVSEIVVDLVLKPSSLIQWFVKAGA